MKLSTDRLIDLRTLAHDATDSEAMAMAEELLLRRAAAGGVATADVTTGRPCMRTEHNFDVAFADMHAHREQLWLNDETCVPVFFRVTVEGALERWLPDLARWYWWNPSDAPHTAWIRCSFLTVAADAGQSESVTIHKGVTPGPSRLWSEL